MNVSFNDDLPVGILVPPLLFIPLIENLFKHSLDKNRNDNAASFFLEIKDRYLFATVSNSMIADQPGSENGFGLKNLKERLNIIYRNDYFFKTEKSKGQFIIHLKIPVQ